MEWAGKHKLCRGAGLPLRNLNWERLLSCKVPPLFPPHYKSLKKNAGQALGGGGEQAASAPWLLNGVCKGNEDPSERAQFPKLLFIAESESHNPALCAGSVWLPLSP